MTDHTQDAVLFETHYRSNVDLRASDAEIRAAWLSSVGIMWRSARRSIPQGDEPASPCPCPNLQLEHDDDTGGAFCIGKCPAQGDELPPLPEPWEDRESQYETAEFATIEKMSAEIKAWRDYGAACRAGRAKGEDARDAVTEPKSCWSCGRMYTEDQRLDADGDCPHCGVEIEAAATAPEGKGE